MSAQDVIDAAWAWAESTRVYPPDGDHDAENHLLECAQSLYNADTSGPPVNVVNADTREHLALIDRLVAEVLSERRPTSTATDAQREAWARIYEARQTLKGLVTL